MKKDTRLKVFTVPIFTEEYKVYVYIGDRDKTNKAINRYLGTEEDLIRDKNRGKCVYKEMYHPCMWIEGDMDYKNATATIAHEAIHAVSYIMDYLGMDLRDDSGNEFLAHGVSAILRTCLPDHKIKSKIIKKK